MSSARVLYIANLDFSTTSAALGSAFAELATEAHVILDAETQRSRGFGVVVVPAESSEAAIKKMDGASVDGRKIQVSAASQSPLFRMWLMRSPNEFPESVRKLIGK